MQTCWDVLATCHLTHYSTVYYMWQDSRLLYNIKEHNVNKYLTYRLVSAGSDGGNPIPET
jgi:hypothetical protein